jgi:hypothetical protein
VEKGLEERRRATSFGLVAVGQDKALALTDLRRVFGKQERKEMTCKSQLGEIFWLDRRFVSNSGGLWKGS